MTENHADEHLVHSTTIINDTDSTSCVDSVDVSDAPRASSPQAADEPKPEATILVNSSEDAQSPSSQGMEGAGLQVIDTQAATVGVTSPEGSRVSLTQVAEEAENQTGSGVSVAENNVSDAKDIADQNEVKEPLFPTDTSAKSPEELSESRFQPPPSKEGLTISLGKEAHGNKRRHEEMNEEDEQGPSKENKPEVVLGDSVEDTTSKNKDVDGHTDDVEGKDVVKNDDSSESRPQKRVKLLVPEPEPLKIRIPKRAPPSPWPKEKTVVVSTTVAKKTTNGEKSVTTIVKGKRSLSLVLRMGEKRGPKDTKVDQGKPRRSLRLFDKAQKLLGL